MSSTTEALATLHKQLDRLLPAVDHIEAARAVTTAADKLPEQHKELLSEHLAEQKRELGNLITEFRQNIESAEQTINRLNEGNATVVAAIRQEHVEGVKSLNITSSKLVDGYKEYTSSLTASLQKLIAELEKKNEQLTSSLEKQNAELTEDVKTRTGELSATGDRMKAYQDTIEEINFPTRLDKLDATVSGIMAATQTTQGRVDNLERSTLEKFGLLSTQTEKIQTELSAKLEATQNSLRSVMMISIVFEMVSLLAIIYLIVTS